MRHKISYSYKTMFANCRIPNGHWRHLCLIAANRTPCRRNQRARLQSHTHGLLLPKESAHPCRSSSQCNRTCSYKPTAAAHASEHTTLQRTSTQLTQVARPGPRLNTSIPDLVPVQRMNARIPVPMWLSQQLWSTDRIEYNWMQRMHLLTDSLCTATLMLVQGTSAEHSVKLTTPAEGAPRLQACINAVELAIIANSIALDTVLKAACTAKVPYSPQ